MDYTKQSLSYKIKKAVRYIQLYGVRRTLAKADAQYHMKKEYGTLPTMSNNNNKAHVGILGCGKFSHSNIAYYLKKNFGNVIQGCMDIDINHAASLAEKYKANYYTDDPMKIINDSKIDLIFIASNHATHAEYAIEAMKQGKAVHIEKPHAVNTKQLVELCKTIEEYNGRARMGFNRPNSKLGQMIMDALAKEEGAAMLNWFVAGHEIEPGHWYFAEKEGGRVLGNLCHWTDLVLQMIPEDGRFPVKIIPSRSKKSDCDISVSFIFKDDSIGTITFSAKGHTFEGVRETLNGHKGNVLVHLKDFKEVRIDKVEKVTKKKLWLRDHGHQKAIINSYKMLKDESLKENLRYIWDTGYLVIKTKEALESFETVIVEPFETSFNKEKQQYITNENT